MARSTVRAAAALRYLVALMSLAACNGDVGVVTEPGTIDRDPDFEAADVPYWQTARDVEVTLRTAGGRPAGGVRVAWSAIDGGRVTPAFSTTDASGTARARWTLGDSMVHAVTAKARGFTARTIYSSPRFTEALPVNRFMRLDLATYDGSGQTVHPDYLQLDGSGFDRAFLAITPYRSGITSYENPSLYESSDDVRWSAPLKTINPIARPTEQYLSDPDLLYDADARELLMYFREVGAENTIWLIRSKDAREWTRREAVVRAPNHQIVSPAVVRRGPADWLMWAVNAHSGCADASAHVELRRSSNGRNWSEPEVITIEQDGLMPWHIEVQWVPSRGEYWALYNVKSPGTCNTQAVYLATSRDGVNWTTYPSPIVTAGTTEALKDIVYRSTFRYEPASDAVTFWFSGARYDGSAFVWNTVAQRRNLRDVFSSIARPAVLGAPGTSGLRKVPQLRRAP